MPPNYFIAVGASTGGIDALKVIVEDLPHDFPAAVLIVQHTSPSGPNVLDHILTRAGALPARNAVDGERIEAGQLYVAPADYHLLLEPTGHARVTRGPKENRVRPAIDPLFRSAAAAFGPRVIGCVLTGLLDDGTAGLWAIKEQGGIAIVQHPEEAIAPSMPSNALKHVEVNHCVRLREIAPLLVRLTQTPPARTATQPVAQKLQAEIHIAREEEGIAHRILEWGTSSIYACPECHGVLMERTEGSHVRFRCHTGHAYAWASLLAELTEKSESALWNAIRSLEEMELLLRRTADDLSAQARSDEAAALRQKADDANVRGGLVRQAIMSRPEISGGHEAS